MITPIMDGSYSCETLEKNRDLLNKKIIRAELSTSKAGYESSVTMIHKAAFFAWQRYAGELVSYKLEDALTKLSEPHTSNSMHLPEIGTIKLRSFQAKKEDPRPAILHVISYTHESGGHTRQMIRMISNTSDIYRHSIVDINDTDIAPVVKSYSSKYKFPYVTLGKLPRYSDKIRSLKEIIMHFDYIVLHTHPDDPMAVLPFLKDSTPPVFFMNHAEHVFWLGYLSTDSVISERQSAVDLVIKKRGIKENSIVPIPLDIPEAISSNFLSKNTARMHLGLHAHPTILTVASAFKYYPWDKFDFFDKAAEILNKTIDAQIVAVGVDGDSNWIRLSKKFPGRVKTYGVMPLTDDLFLSSDIFLDSFPFSSFTSKLEAGLHGLPVVSVSNDEIPILSCDDPALDKFEESNLTLDNLTEIVYGLLMDEKYKKNLGKEMMDSIVSIHTGEKYKVALEKAIGTVQEHKTRDLSDIRVVEVDDFDCKLASISSLWTKGIFRNYQYYIHSNLPAILDSSYHWVADYLNVGKWKKI